MRETYNIFWFLRIKNFKRAWQLFRLLFSPKRGKYPRMDTWHGLIELTYCKVFGHKPNYSNLRDTANDFDLFDLFGDDDDDYKKEEKVYLTEEECEQRYQKMLREKKLGRILK